MIFTFTMKDFGHPKFLKSQFEHPVMKILAKSLLSQATAFAGLLPATPSWSTPRKKPPTMIPQHTMALRDVVWPRIMYDRAWNDNNNNSLIQTRIKIFFSALTKNAMPGKLLHDFYLPNIISDLPKIS